MVLLGTPETPVLSDLMVKGGRRRLLHPTHQPCLREEYSGRSSPGKLCREQSISALLSGRSSSLLRTLSGNCMTGISGGLAALVPWLRSPVSALAGSLSTHSWWALSLPPITSAPGGRFCRNVGHQPLRLGADERGGLWRWQQIEQISRNAGR